MFRYVFPKQLLSQQFWHPKQKKEFVLEEYEKRSQYYYSLVREVGVTCKEIKNRQFFRLCIEVNIRRKYALKFTSNSFRFTNHPYSRLKNYTSINAIGNFKIYWKHPTLNNCAGVPENTILTIFSHLCRSVGEANIVMQTICEPVKK